MIYVEKSLAHVADINLSENLYCLSLYNRTFGHRLLKTFRVAQLLTLNLHVCMSLIHKTEIVLKYSVTAGIQYELRVLYIPHAKLIHVKILGLFTRHEKT